MIVKTTGVVLRLDPFSKTSQVVTWLTPDQGRVVTLAKGAKRRRSLLLGQYDLFQTCEFLFYQSPRGTLQILKECAPLALRESFRHDWRTYVAASYICDLLNRLTPTGVAQADLFTYAEAALDFLCEHGASAAILHWHELRLLGLLGVAPQFNSCQQCGLSEFGGQAPCAVSFPKGGVLCAACRSRIATNAVSLSHDCLSMLRVWQSSSPLLAKRTACTRSQSEMIEEVLGKFLDYHLETAPRSRAMAVEFL